MSKLHLLTRTAKRGNGPAEAAGTSPARVRPPPAPVAERAIPGVAHGAPSAGEWGRSLLKLGSLFKQ